GGVDLDDCSFNLAGDFGQGRRAVRRGKFNSVVFRRIMRGGEIDGAGQPESAHRIGNRRGGGGFGNYDRGNGRGREHARGFIHKTLTQEARIAPDQDPMRAWLRPDVSCDTRNGAPDIGHREFVGHDSPPAGRAKFDGCTHRLSPINFRTKPQGPYCNTDTGWASDVMRRALLQPGSRRSVENPSANRL